MRLLTLLLVLLALSEVQSQNYGWYDNVPCHPACKNCFYGQNNWYCYTCAGNHISYGWQWYYSYCYCDTGFVQVYQSNCAQCSLPCNTCTNGNPSTCQTCSSITRAGTPTCACIAGYYDVSQKDCATCSYQCTTCVSAATNCLTCATTRASPPSCGCTDGYYQTQTKTCPNCHYSCLTCNAGTSTACLTCSSANQRYKSGSSCLCNNPYYDNGASSACQPCNYRCASCVSSAGCTSCTAANNRFLGSTSSYCLCNDRYYDPGTQICSSCHPTCYRCSSSTSTSCSACNSLAFRTLSGSTCICMNGYYQTLSNLQLCTICSYSCLTCVSSSTNCLTCNTTLNRAISGTSCPCKAGYFENTTLLCETCHSSCATCTSKTQCVTCISSQATTLNASSLCSCVSGQYYTGSVCAACNYKCLTCVGTATNCTSCQAGVNRVYKSNACNCISNYYDSGSVVCTACAYSCLTCNGVTKTNCLSCSGSTLRVLSSSSCNCPTRYFDDGSSPSCSPCYYSCLTCSSATACLSCSSALFRTLNTTTSLCQCNSNYFQSYQSCYPCLSTCLTCSNNQTCVSCNSALQLTLSSGNLCVCATGYYNASNVCLACNSVCQTCAAASTCLTCKSGLNRIYNSATSSCDCQSGYILNMSSNLCLGCQYSCQVCVTNYTNQCSSCNASYYRTLNTTTKQCSCNIGYYDNNAALCLACSYTCYTCSVSSTNCTACTTGSNRNLNSVAGTCSCAQHYYDTIVIFAPNVACAACSYFCSSCTNSSACLTCNSTNKRTFDSLGVNCICAQGYYDDNSSRELCVACPYQCLSCSNSSVCLTCNNSNNRATPTSLCPCIVGYYDTNLTAQLCAACQYSCKACTVFTRCDSCQTSYNRVYNSTTKYCSCLGRYYDPGSQICESCAYSCLTCSGSPLTCLTCNTTALRALKAVTQTCPCNNGYYDAAVQPCLPCNYTCRTCGNKFSCLSCDLTKFRTINPANGLCICITGYYDNNSSEVCRACNLTCLTCLNNTTCLSCDSTRFRVYNTTRNYANVSDPFCTCLYGYYSLGVNASCAACHFSCAACNGTDKTSCLLCDSNSNRTINSSACICNQGYYDTNLTMNCPLCHIACSACWQGLNTTCFTCSSTFFMMTGKNTCYYSCPTYYFNNVSAMICTLCATNCLSCYNSTNCTQCEAPTFLFNASCLPDCPLGYYANTTLRVCILCRVGCVNCSTSSNCFKCANSTYYVDKATTLCFLCSSKCVTCFGPNPNQCLNCTYPQYLNDQTTCVNISCPYGKYIDTFKGCVNCSSLFTNSLTCNNQQALLCIDTTQLLKGRCVACESVQGYAIDSIGQCNEICGDGIVIKYQCDDGNNRNGDGCSSNCVIQDGWKCLIVSNRSRCTLNSAVSMNLKQYKKYPRYNKLLITLTLSIPLYLDKSNFALLILDFDLSSYTVQILPQTAALTEISVVMTYSQSIQSKAIQISYGNTRRRLEAEAIDSFSERRLVSSSFQTQIVVSAFPPANYIDVPTTTFYQQGVTVIYYLSIALVCLNLLIVPQRYAVHSLTISWLVPYFYTTFYQATPATNEWISSTLSKCNYQSLFGGFNLGSCCYSDTLYGITSQIFKNSGFIFSGIILVWILFFLSKLVDKCRKVEKESKISSILKYYLLTLHLTVFLQLTFSSMYALSKYQLNNRIDAANITISLFATFAAAFLVVMLWYITAKNKFIGTQQEIQSKVATRQSATVQNSHKTEQADYNQVINLSQIKQTTRYEDSKFYASNNKFRASNNSHFREEEKESQTRSEVSQKQQMGNDESLLPYDYCYIYKNKDKRSKYYLPLLINKLFAVAFLNVVLQNSPFYMMVLNTIIGLVSLLFVSIVRPFNSTFTNVRNIIVQLLVTLVNGLYCVYLYYAKSQIYIVTLQTLIICGIIAIIAFSIIFSFIQHYRIWIYKIWRLCDGCCMYFRLRGKSQKVMDQSPQRQQIEVQAVSQAEMMQSDAFYARFLKKQVLNRQFKNERMGRNSFQKDFL